MSGFNFALFVMSISALILGITVHEWSHAIVADKLGDDTPRRQGRVTLWPLAHLDPVGTLLMVVSALVGFGIGWGRPVQTDPRNYRINRRIADSLVSFAGPLSNLVIAAVFALLLRSGLVRDEAFLAWAIVTVSVNIFLFLFNLLPIFPLDGSHLLANALSPSIAEKYRDFMMRYGIFLFIGLVMFGKLSVLLTPAHDTIYRLLLGSPAG